MDLFAFSFCFHSCPFLSHFSCLKPSMCSPQDSRGANTQALEYRYQETWHVYSRQLDNGVVPINFIWIVDVATLCLGFFLAVCRFQEKKRVQVLPGGILEQKKRGGDREEEGKLVWRERDNQMLDEVMLSAPAPLLLGNDGLLTRPH